MFFPVSHTRTLTFQQPPLAQLSSKCPYNVFSFSLFFHGMTITHTHTYPHVNIPSVRFSCIRCTFKSFSYAPHPSTPHTVLYSCMMYRQISPPSVFVYLSVCLSICICIYLSLSLSLAQHPSPLFYLPKPLPF